MKRYNLFLTNSIFLWRINVEEEFPIDKLPEYKKYMKETKRLIPKLWQINNNFLRASQLRSYKM